MLSCCAARIASQDRGLSFFFGRSPVRMCLVRSNLLSCTGANIPTSCPLPRLDAAPGSVQRARNARMGLSKSAVVELCPLPWQSAGRGSCARCAEMGLTGQHGSAGLQVHSE